MGELIAAVATPPGVGGIGVVRLSGNGALAAADRMLHLAGDKCPTNMKGYTCAYGKVYDDRGVIDEAVLTVFREPKSYTGEDVAEIAAHGGGYLLNRILRACCANGARLARPGEFTRRAFLNGKLDLTQAEAVADLIGAQGEQAASAALAAREGTLSRELDHICGRLVGYAANLVAWMDYPEEELIQVDAPALRQGLEECRNGLGDLLSRYDTGRLIRDGVETAIVGRPNAGKSTLMNLLAGYDRSIVTALPGTTRDIVSDTVRLGELLLKLSDTAGIRQAVDPVEQEGVRLAERELARAQLVLAVFDGSQPLSEDDRRVVEQCGGRTAKNGGRAIALVNKGDLEQRINTGELEGVFDRVIWISAKNGEGADMLLEAVKELFALGVFDPAAAMAANERQREGLIRAMGETEEALEALRGGVSYDAVCVCIERGVDALLEVTGKRASDAVIDAVFSRFCIGK